MLGEEPIDAEKFWPPRSRAGTIIPHKLELPLLIRAVPGVTAFFDREVPEEFWSEDVESGHAEIVIACPCGEEPKLVFGLRAYSIAACACGRIFMHDGRRVRVGRDS